jgi:hypothetical protein
MDATVFQVIATIIVGLVGSGGVVAWRKQRRQSDAGMPSDESEARQIAPAAEWLTDYYKAELEALKGDLKSELKGVRDRVKWLEDERELDAEHIDALEAHIWQQLPPPPPPRRRQPRKAKP